MKVHPLKGPELLDPVWFRGIQGRFFPVVVRDGGVVLDGVSLAFTDDERPADGTEVVVGLGRNFTCITKSDMEEAKAAREADEARARESERLRLNHERDAAIVANGALRLPVEWSPGIKDVLSGLAADSWGDGANARTVVHITLAADISFGRIKRRAGDFLCTTQSGSNGIRWSGSTSRTHVDGDGNPYPARITCASCLKLAARFQPLPAPR